MIKNMKHGHWLRGMVFAQSLLLSTSVMADTITWLITDLCTNTEEIRYRFYSDPVDPPVSVWPPSGQYFITKRLGETYRSTFSCPRGVKVCYGAWQENGNAWGVGRNANLPCTNCCTSCDGREHPMTLICE